MVVGDENFVSFKQGPGLDVSLIIVGIAKGL
jgi:hypothetical protein